MIINKYILDIIDSNMFVCVEDNYAVIIDPIDNPMVKEKLLENKVSKIYIMLTHEHIDHISGVNCYSEFDTLICCSEKCKNNIESDLHKLKLQFAAIFVDADVEQKQKVRQLLNSVKDIKIDRILKDEELLLIGKHKFFIRYTPGHTSGSIIIIMDNKILFTGDSLLADRSVITNLPDGNMNEYKNVTIPIFEQLDGELMVYPGHGNIENLSVLRRW